MRRLAVQAHLWLGLTVGAFWALQGLTGALLVFNRDIQAVVLPNDPAGGKRMPIDAIVRSAGAAAGAQVSMIEAFVPGRELFLAHYRDGQDRPRTLVVDGGTGVVLDRRDPEAPLPQSGSAWGWILRLHKTLLSGETGHYLVGASGVLLTSDVLFGLYLAWPRSGYWRQAFAPSRWRTAMQRLFGWHRMIGLLATGALLVTALTGAYLVFCPPLRVWMADRGWYQPPFKPEPVKKLAPFSLNAEQALTISRRNFPNAAIFRVTLPSAQSPAYLFRLLQKEEWRRIFGATTVAVDPWSGRVTYLYDAVDGPLANRINDLALPIHNADAGGVLGRLLLVSTGLALPVFYVTGILAWLRRRKRRAAPATIHARALPPPPSDRRRYGK